MSRKSILPGSQYGPEVSLPERGGEAGLVLCGLRKIVDQY